MEIALLAGAAILLFGGNKIRDVARGLGAAKKEFTIGQAEADVAAERLRAEARAQAEANANANVNANGVTVGPAPGTASAPGTVATPFVSAPAQHGEPTGPQN